MTVKGSKAVRRLLQPMVDALLHEQARVAAARENAGATLDVPRQWLPISHVWRISTPTPKLLKSRKRYKRCALALVKALDGLHQPVRECCGSEPATGEHSEQAKRHMDAYELALCTVARSLAPMQVPDGRGSAVHQAAQRLRAATADLETLTRLSPSLIGQFDAAQYLEASPDVAAAIKQGNCYSALDHFYSQGAFEALQGGRVAAGVDLSELAAALGSLPADSQAIQGEAQEPTVSGTAQDGMAATIKYFANPGPRYEAASTIDATGLPAKVRAIAFYLPQFYSFAENDKWWGDGFTEWRNVARGAPRFSGHYQPRVPRDLGFYNLTDVNTIKAQSALAKKQGIEAFCFYYYWFDGKRLMDKPLDLFVEADIDQEFCIMWANENWTRTWDGFDSEVLIEQTYNDADEDAFIDDTARYMAHPRYTCVDGRPLFILYRPGLLPDAAATLARWRTKWQDRLGVAPWVMMVQGFDDMDPRRYGLDGAVEFPPHKVATDTQDINESLNIFDPDFSGNVRAYADVVNNSLSEPDPDFPLIKTVSPHWDNDARREGRGFTLQGSTPSAYESWLRGTVAFAQRAPFAGERLVFINAWNEWAEGAYLEPDVHYGHAYLNATQRAVYGLCEPSRRQKVLLVGHDAYRHGAQMLLLNIARCFSRQFGLEVLVLLKQGGPLLAEYREVARTLVLDDIGLDNLANELQVEEVDQVLTNTSVTGDLVPLFKQMNLPVVSLVHELPNLMRDYQLEGSVAAIAHQADHVVFASDLVQRGFTQVAGGDVAADCVVRPQGTYKSIAHEPDVRQRLRDELGIADTDKVVINVGFADLRKGFDLFLQTAARVSAERCDIHFLWLGALDNDMRHWVQDDVSGYAAADRIHLVGFTDNVADYYAAADCLYLTSREDPYPTVVLEAMQMGMPVVSFAGATGCDDIVGEFGYLLTSKDPVEIDQTLRLALDEVAGEKAAERIEYISRHCRFDNYCHDLLKLLNPLVPKVSVIVPNYNYAEHLPERLMSVFEQAHAVFEVIVLDDCSSDDSLRVIEQIAADAGRDIRLVVNTENSGNVFRQWKKGLSLCSGDYVWIAEADDSAAPELLSQCLHSMDAQTALAFCDSRQVDAKGKQTADSYGYYYKTVDEALFSKSFRQPGTEFLERAMAVRNVMLNVSSVVWRRDALMTALATVGDQLETYRLVGDWRLYLEVLSQPGVNVSFVNDNLNVHRRHDESVTHALDHKNHINEIQAMHAEAMRILGSDDELKLATTNYILELCAQFGVKPDVVGLEKLPHVA